MPRKCVTCRSAGYIKICIFLLPVFLTIYAGVSFGVLNKNRSSGNIKDQTSFSTDKNAEDKSDSSDKKSYFLSESTHKNLKPELHILLLLEQSSGSEIKTDYKSGNKFIMTEMKLSSQGILNGIQDLRYETPKE